MRYEEPGKHGGANGEQIEIANCGAGVVEKAQSFARPYSSTPADCG